MTYVADRHVLDADAHLMEPAGWLESYADPEVRPAIPPIDAGDAGLTELLAESSRQHARRRSDPDEARQARQQLMTMPRKGWLAFGSADPAERSTALDDLGFALQVVYPTASFPQVMATPAGAQVGAALAMNRGLAEFCAADDRLLPVAYVPFHHGPDAALRVLADAVAKDIPLVMVDMVPPDDGRSPTHPDFDPVWAAIVDAGRLVTVHIGLDNGWRPVRPSFFDNGRQLPHFRSDAPGDALSYMAIGYPAQLFLSAMTSTGCWSGSPDCASASPSSAPSGCPASCNTSTPRREPFAASRTCRSSRCHRRITSAATYASRRSPASRSGGWCRPQVPSCTASPPTTRTTRAPTIQSAALTARWAT